MEHGSGDRRLFEFPLPVALQGIARLLDERGKVRILFTLGGFLQGGKRLVDRCLVDRCLVDLSLVDRAFRFLRKLFIGEVFFVRRIVVCKTLR